MERAQEIGLVGRREETWTGLDNADYEKNMAARHARQSPDGKGVDALGGVKPFTLHPDGVGWLYVSSGLKDGPLPTHYEPLESVMKNPLYEQQTILPPIKNNGRIIRTRLSSAIREFPYVLTTYRLTEHHTAGGMSRHAFSPGRIAARIVLRSFARACGGNRLGARRLGDDLTARARNRGARSGHAPHAAAVRSMARTVHQVGLPYHWGYQAWSTAMS